MAKKIQIVSNTCGNGTFVLDIGLLNLIHCNIIIPNEEDIQC